MKRRDFITLAISAALAPSLARAQGNARHIGVLMQFREDVPEVAGWVGAFREELHNLGWTEGRNLRSDYRWGGIDDVALKGFAKEIVASRPDLIVSSSSLTTTILKSETATIPIIFTNVVDPVGQGLVSSLSRPGGNITGFVNLEPSVSGKYVELLKELVPGLQRIAIFFNPTTTPYSDIYLKPFEAAAAALGIEAIATPVRDLAELDAVMAAQAQRPNAGLIAMPSGFASGNYKEIAALTLRHKLPMVTTVLAGAHHGALLAYGNDIVDNYRRVASYVNRVLRGEKPGELPVQFPTKFRMAINLKTAKMLGLDVPLFFQQRADEVIE
jgi:putative ABC transport system substrate-binding protein